ncbi:MAG: type II secretion system F family protein [Candidatus Micrarchaeota archaeon]|nr:type II secretion system F family protein [Candidatus Micrarchaeota archaeon]
MLKKDMLAEFAFIATGTALILANSYYLAPIVAPFDTFLNIIGAMIAIVPPFVLFYSKYKKNKELEEQFIIFMADLTESINAGMTLPIGLASISNKNYRSLSPYIKEMAAKVEWGVPFQDALDIFGKKINNKNISRAVTTIIETYGVGGKIADTLKAISQSLIQINEIKKERSASIQSQIMTLYLIYFVFVFILIVLQTFLIPALSVNIPGVSDITGFQQAQTPKKVQTEVYTQAFLNFILIEGIFAGIATGKMAEGSLVAGLKHSIILTVLGYSFYALASQFNIAMALFPV